MGGWVCGRKSVILILMMMMMMMMWPTHKNATRALKPLKVVMELLVRARRGFGGQSRRATMDES